MKRIFIFVIAILIPMMSLAQKPVWLTIGDSNGTGPEAWPAQLQRVMPSVQIINHSIPGNTIGFDNLGRKDLNTLRNIHRYLEESENEINGREPQHILILLGTNDSKKVFANRQAEVKKNMVTLINDIRAYYQKRNQKANITLISPPPMAPDWFLIAKYHGGDSRLAVLTKAFEGIAKKEHCGFVNLYKPFHPIWMAMTKDGVHMTNAGEYTVARYIVLHLGIKLPKIPVHFDMHKH